MNNIIKLRTLFFLITIVTFNNSFAQNSRSKELETDSLVSLGQWDYSSEFFRERLLHNNFTSFIDNYTDAIIFQTHNTIGDLNTPENPYISVQGNSYRWNKYYINNFRMDSRLTPGSYLYEQDLYSTSFNMDTYSSSFHFTKDKKVENGALLRYNVGNIGGITPGTEWFFNLFHYTAEQTAMKPFNERKHLNGQGVFIFDYTTKKNLHQHLYVDFGQREMLDYDFASNRTPYYENFVKAELSGDLPVRENGLLDNLQYAAAFSHRDNMHNEIFYSKNETAEQDKYSASVYGSRNRGNSSLTTGFTASLHNTTHNEPNFSRNFMDVDGESFSPFYTDGQAFEITHALKYKYQILESLNFNLETYNSVIGATPNKATTINPIYFESMVNPENDKWTEEENPYYTSLYLYENSANGFTTGLLENTAGFSFSKEVARNFYINSNINGSLDAIILKDKSIVRPNWEADLALNWKPSRYFSIGLNGGRKRIAFNYDMARYLSNDYLSQDIYYWKDLNSDKKYQDGERSDFIQSKSGKYREAEKGIKQPAYAYVELPILISLGNRHTLSIVTTYKKYTNQWHTEFEKSPEQYGYFEKDGEKNIFFFNEGQDINYLINSDRPEAMDFGQSSAFLTNTPFAFVNIAKYSYDSPKSFFSVSWVSQFMMNVADLGNSPLESNMEAYSDAVANPNTKILSAGRPQQDRGYVARLLYGYKFTDNFKASFLFKFIDGQPFSKYNTRIKRDANGNTQIAAWRYSPNSTSPLYDEWGNREDMGFNTELRLQYTAHIGDYALDINLAGYNLIDFGYELLSNGFDLPMERFRTSVDMCSPRGMMLTAKMKF